MKKIGSYGGASSGLTGGKSGFVKKKRFYIEDGSNLFRLLPPFGSLADVGAIAKYHENYWLKNSNGKPFPVLSTQIMNRDKVIVKRDPIADAINTKKQELETLKAAGADKALIEAFENDVKGLNLDKAFYANVMNPAGEIGILKIKTTAWNSLKEMLKKLDAEGIDPINIGKNNGIIFDFKRYKDESGKTIYRTDIAMVTKKDPNTGRAVSEYQYLELDETVFARMEKEAEDLAKCFKEFTQEERVLLASLDPKTIDRVLQRPTPVEATSETADAEYVDPNDTVYAAPAKKAATTAVPQSNVTGTNIAMGSATVVKTAETTTTQAYTGPTASTNDKVKAFLASRKTTTSAN